MSNEYSSFIAVRLLVVFILCSRVSSSLSTRYNHSQLVSSSKNEIRNAHFPTLWAPDMDSLCYNDSKIYFQAYFKREKWAVTMFKATALLSFEGLRNMDVLTTSPGLFDECLSVESPHDFNAQYCSVFFKEEHPTILETGSHDMNKTSVVNLTGDGYTYTLPRVGFCIPSSCSPLDFRSAMTKMIAYSIDDFENYSEDSRQTSYNTSHRVLAAITDENYCYTKKKITESAERFDQLTIAFIAIISLLGVVVLSATLHDAWTQCFTRMSYQTNNNNTLDHSLIKILHCFSALKNGGKILSTEAPSSDLSCLHGIRFLSSTWIILYHSNYHIEPSAAYNSFGPNRKHLYEWAIQAFTRGSIAVDTFFTMSGLLLGYSLLKELERNKGRFNIFSFLFHRFIRIAPFYYFYLGFVAILLVYMGTGPLWHYVHQMKENCFMKWWAHLLFINNYFAEEKTTDADCMDQSWYLAADMQLFIVSGPIFVYPLWRWKRAGLAWIAFAITTVMVTILTMYISWTLPAITCSTIERPKEGGKSTYPEFYYQAWARLPQYLAGITLSWLIIKFKDIKLHSSGVASGWILSIATLLAIIYGLTPFLNEDLVPVMNIGIRVMYGTFHRFAWAVAICWIVFASVNGYGGFVNTFLSWKGFIPLGRLTFIAYLVHYDFLRVYYIALPRIPFYYTKLNVVTAYLAAVVVSFLLAFFLSIAIEMPFVNLGRHFLNRKTTKQADMEVNPATALE